MQKLRPETVRLDQLLLDPNNFRFEGEKKRKRISSKRFAEPAVQAGALLRLETDGIDELKESILTNGFLPVERIVVREWTESAKGDQKYVVLEGNRRTATLGRIEKDAAAGTEVPAEIIDSLATLPVIVLEDNDESAYLSIMGIRHVGGIKAWGGYQSAALISDLKTKHKMSSRDVGSTVGLSVQEVNRRYRSFRALEQMRADEEFGEYVDSDLYPLFHEALATPALRAWLLWSDTKYLCEDEENRTFFYSLLSPFVDQGQETRPPKITTYLQVRELKNVLDNEDALESLHDFEKDFSDAAGFIKAKDSLKDWPTKVKSAAAALNHMGIVESKSLSAAHVKVLGELKVVVDTLLAGSSGKNK